ncbi:MAG: class I SAM-dependent methyltransferase [Longimicrobiales bacterium]
MTGGAAGAGAEPITLPARDAYRLWARSYDAENAVTVLEQCAVLALTPPLAGTWLLDAGCGTGRRLPRAGKEGPARVVGVDLVFEMLNVRARADVSLVVADVRALPCRAHSFHVIWCRLAAGHLPELDGLYAELARVARAGAHVIVTDFHPAAARAGHTRSFRDEDGQLHSVEHFIHDIDAHLAAAQSARLTLVACQEPAVGPEVRHFYAAARRLDAYDRQQELPLVLALALRA